MQKSLRLAISVLLLLVTAPQVVAASTPDEQYSFDRTLLRPPASGLSGVLVQESMDYIRQPSMLFGYDVKTGSVPFVNGFCSSLSDSICQQSPFVKYYAQMQPCSSPADNDCIENVFARSENSTEKVYAQFKQSLPASSSHPYIADPARGLPPSGTAGIWSFPNVIHGGGGNDYAVIVSQIGSLKRVGKDFVAQPAGTDPWGGGDFKAGIFPVNMVSDSGYEQSIARLETGTSGIPRISVSFGGSKDFSVCAITSDGECALRQSFPSNTRFGLSLRFSKKINGWMHGRIGSPDLAYTQNGSGTRVVIEADPIKVPIVAGVFKLSSVIESDIANLGPNSFRENSLMAPDSTSTKHFSTYLKYIGDKAVAAPYNWTFYNLGKWDLNGADECITENKALSGMVATNSTTYEAGPPIFNKNTQSLDYTVASAHLLPDGTVFKGSYDLYISKAVAQCFYKFGNVPVRASVSIVSADGVSSVATTTFSEKNGWIRLSANGFTFSSPTIRVKFLEVKRTISCTKGKVTKKVSGISPKCPSGYKTNPNAAVKLP